MEVGNFIMPMHPPGSEVAKTLDDDLEQVIFMDALGYREVWIGEHFTSVWENIPAPDLFLAKAIGYTKNIKLCTGVTCMPNHNPFMIAHRIAQLDNLARGRFQWGVGSGGFPGDFTVFGFDPDTGEHRGMTREAIDLVLKLWEDPTPGVYKNKYWNFTVPEPEDTIGLRYHLKPYQKPHPPIAVAGVSPKSDTLILAGERGYIPMSINLVPTPTLRNHWEAVEEGASKSGLTPDHSIWRIAREIYIADTDEQARKEVMEGTIGRDYNDYFIPLLDRSKLLRLCKIDPDMPDSEVTPEYFIDNIFIVGSPESVAERLRQLYHDVGGFGVLLSMGHEWQPKEAWVESTRRLKQEVLPMLADLN